MYTLHTLEMWDNNKITKLHIRFKQLKKLKSLGGWVGGKVRNGGHNESNCLPFGHMTQPRPFGHMTYTQASSCVWEKHFSLILLTLASGKLPFFSLCWISNNLSEGILPIGSIQMASFSRGSSKSSLSSRTCISFTSSAASLWIKPANKCAALSFPQRTSTRWLAVADKSSFTVIMISSPVLFVNLFDSSPKIKPLSWGN